jgi:hypothetical protein
MEKRVREQVNQESSPSNSDSVLYPILYVYPNPIELMPICWPLAIHKRIPAVSDVCAQRNHIAHRTAAAQSTLRLRDFLFPVF